MKRMIQSLPTSLSAILIFLLSMGASACTQAQEEFNEVMETPNAERRATAVISPLNNSGVTGSVIFEDDGQFVRVAATVNALSPGKHGFHIHEGLSCDDYGGHFAPDSSAHGSPDEVERHLGDLGQLVAEDDSTARYERVDHRLTLTGDNSIIGHAVIVHAGEDEYLPQPSGDSGMVVACGVVEMDWQATPRAPAPVTP
jgi:Cu-Zn family superoxide dismutase